MSTSSCVDIQYDGARIRALVGYDPSDLFPASRFITQVLPQCPPDLTLVEGRLSHLLLLIFFADCGCSDEIVCVYRSLPISPTANSFQTGRSHILLVSKTPGQDQGVLGIVTLEDVVEVNISSSVIDCTNK